MNPEELERLVDRDLKRLPAPRAPHTLLPRVMAAVQEWASRPWYTGAWFTWPRGWQVASVAALVVLITGAALAAPHVESSAAGAIASVQARFVSAVPAVEAPVAATSAGILWRTLLEPLVNYAVVIIVLMFLACAVFGTALNHVVIERAEQR